MEDEVKRLENYYPKQEKSRTQKENTLHIAREFYKGRKMILVAFEKKKISIRKCK